MAETLKLPKQVINSNWKDDIDIDYATSEDIKDNVIDFEPYPEEADYVSKKKVSKESLARIKARNQRIGAKTFFFATQGELAAQL